MAAQASHSALAGKNIWQVGQSAVVPVGEDLLHDRVVAVLLLRLDQVERGIGEHGVVAPGREQLILPGRLVLVADPADDQPGGDGLAFLRGERGLGHLGDLGVGHPAAELVIPDRTRVPDRRPGFFRDSGDLGVHVHHDREPGAAPADRAGTGTEVTPSPSTRRMSCPAFPGQGILRMFTRLPAFPAVRP